MEIRFYMIREQGENLLDQIVNYILKYGKISKFNISLNTMRELINKYEIKNIPNSELIEIKGNTIKVKNVTLVARKIPYDAVYECACYRIEKIIVQYRFNIKRTLERSGNKQMLGIFIYGKDKSIGNIYHWAIIDTLIKITTKRRIFMDHWEELYSQKSKK